MRSKVKETESLSDLIFDSLYDGGMVVIGISVGKSLPLENLNLFVEFVVVVALSWVIAKHFLRLLCRLFSYDVGDDGG